MSQPQSCFFYLHSVAYLNLPHILFCAVTQFSQKGSLTVTVLSRHLGFKLVNPAVPLLGDRDGTLVHEKNMCGSERRETNTSVDPV